jgi:hypothetical protein
MARGRTTKIDESSVRYRTARESWNWDKVRPWLTKTLDDPNDDEALLRVGQLVRETMRAELQLAERLAELLNNPKSTIGDYAALFADHGISAASLWFCGSLLQGANRDHLLEGIIKERQRHASLARYANDPKQLAKIEVKRLWIEYRSGAAPVRAKFARDMLEKFEVLASQKKIEDWTREWDKQEPREI